MQAARGFAAAGQNKAVQRFNAGHGPIDGGFQGGNLFAADVALFRRRPFAVAGQFGAKPENLLLDGLEQGAVVFIRGGAGAQAQRGVQLVQRAVGFNPRVGFAHPLAGKE